MGKKKATTYSITVSYILRNSAVAGSVYTKLGEADALEVYDRLKKEFPEAIKDNKYLQIDTNCGVRGEEIVSYAIYKNEEKD